MLHPKLSSIPCVEKSATTHVRIYLQICRRNVSGFLIRNYWAQRFEKNTPNINNEIKKTQKNKTTIRTHSKQSKSSNPDLIKPPAQALFGGSTGALPGTGTGAAGAGHRRCTSAVAAAAAALRRCCAASRVACAVAATAQAPTEPALMAVRRPLNLGLEWKYVVKT